MVVIYYLYQNPFFLIKGLGFLLKGVLYSENSSINISAIAINDAALRCLTPSITCCVNDDGMVLGRWKFPNGSTVPSNGDKLYATGGPSSVVLHKINNIKIPSGIYTCEIPDIRGTLKLLNAYLHTGKLPGREIYM